jgi:hypothetical protein
MVGKKHCQVIAIKYETLPGHCTEVLGGRGTRGMLNHATVDQHQTMRLQTHPYSSKSTLSSSRIVLDTRLMSLTGSTLGMRRVAARRQGGTNQSNRAARHVRLGSGMAGGRAASQDASTARQPSRLGCTYTCSSVVRLEVAAWRRNTCCLDRTQHFVGLCSTKVNVVVSTYQH